MELQLKIIGVLLIILAFIHVPFPMRFDWKKDLSALSLMNRQMMYVHTFFIALIILLMGILCISCSEDLINTRLGNKIVLGLFIFWSLRLLIQFFGFSSKLWRGKKFETVIHMLFSIFWTYLTVVFFYIYWINRRG
jgi:hypothetical protein